MYVPLVISVNNILFIYKVHQDTTHTSYIQYITCESDTKVIDMRDELIV